MSLILEQLKKQTEAATQSTGSSFKNESPTASSNELVNGVYVPIEIPRDGGKLRIYLSLPAEVASSPELLNAALDQLEQRYDLAVWRPRAQSQNNGFKSGYNNNNNGYKKRW